MSDESEDYHRGVQDGHEEGYREGKSEGYDEGYEVGYDHGEMTFYESGHDDIIEDWILDGSFDDTVRKRAVRIGYIPNETHPVTEYGEGALQLTHSVMHTSGPTSWEFCGRPPCSKVR